MRRDRSPIAASCPSPVAGQDHLLGPDGALTRLIRSGSLEALFSGAAGHQLANDSGAAARETSLAFVQISAIFTGVADLKSIPGKRTSASTHGPGHAAVRPARSVASTTRQVPFLPVMEDGTVADRRDDKTRRSRLNAALLSRARDDVSRSTGKPSGGLLDRAEAVEAGTSARFTRGLRSSAMAERHDGRRIADAGARREGKIPDRPLSGSIRAAARPSTTRRRRALQPHQRAPQGAAADPVRRSVLRTHAC